MLDTKLKFKKLTYNTDYIASTYIVNIIIVIVIIMVTL